MNTFSENGNDFVGRLLHEGGVSRRTFSAFPQTQTACTEGPDRDLAASHAKGGRIACHRGTRRGGLVSLSLECWSRSASCAGPPAGARGRHARQRARRRTAGYAAPGRVRAGTFGAREWVRGSYAQFTRAKRAGNGLQGAG